jgi:hypothetical protein
VLRPQSDHQGHALVYFGLLFHGVSIGACSASCSRSTAADQCRCGEKPQVQAVRRGGVSINTCTRVLCLMCAYKCSYKHEHICLTYMNSFKTCCEIDSAYKFHACIRKQYVCMCVLRTDEAAINTQERIAHDPDSPQKMCPQYVVALSAKRTHVHLAPGHAEQPWLPDRTAFVEVCRGTDRIYTCVCMYMHVYMYIYIYIYIMHAYVLESFLATLIIPVRLSRVSCQDCCLSCCVDMQSTGYNHIYVCIYTYTYHPVGTIVMY